MTLAEAQELRTLLEKENVINHKKNISTRKYWSMEELRQERERDIKLEMSEKHNY
jgi:hypothetical protein